MKSNFKDLDARILDFNKSYDDYIKAYQKDAYFLINKSNRNKTKILEDLYFFEEKALKKHKHLKNSLFENLKNLRVKIQTASDLESNLKNKMKNCCLTIMKTLSPKDVKFDEKVKILEENLSQFKLTFQNL